MFHYPVVNTSVSFRLFSPGGHLKLSGGRTKFSGGADTVKVYIFYINSISFGGEGGGLSPPKEMPERNTARLTGGAVLD